MQPCQERSAKIQVTNDSPSLLPCPPYSFQSSFLADSPPTTAAAALSRFGDDAAIGGALSTGQGNGARGVEQAGESQPRAGSFLEAVDMAASGSASEGISFAA